MADRERLSHEELKALVRPYTDIVARIVKHVKSDELYVITGVNIRESDLSIEATYRNVRKGWPSFSRPIAEMLDGRFDFGDYRSVTERNGS